MCRAHWFQVPAKLRARVNREWRRRQRGKGFDGHDEAKAAAVAHVEKLERDAPGRLF